MTPREIACIELVELLTEYLEGTLAPDEAAAVEAHLAACTGCRRYLDQMRATIAALGSVPVETLSEQACQTLMEAFGSRLRRAGGDQG